MSSNLTAGPRAELLRVPASAGKLGEIFEAAVLRDTHCGAEGMENRRYIARAVVLVLEVVGEAEYGDETGRVAPLVPGSCFLIDPGLGHRYGPRPGSRWAEMYVCFRGPIFDTLVTDAGLMESPVRQLSPVAMWQGKLANVLPYPGGYNDTDSCIGRLLAFLAEAFCADHARGGNEAWLDMAKRMLGRENFSVAETTSQLAGTTGLAPDTLRKAFRELTGYSMKSWQVAGKVAAARHLLSRGGLSQKEISEALGFSSPQHFSRCLKKETGFTPGELAKKR